MAFRYADVIQFEPIERVVELRSSGTEKQAIRLVSTYVISDRMADQIINQLFPVLNLEESRDSMGVFVVGNYGTGKSHLMSVLAGIAENEKLVQYLTHPKVAEACTSFAGRYKVIREEIGATTMPLSRILVRMIEQGLSAMGVDYTFPSTDQVINFKDAFHEMMAAFHAVYPNQGLLLVVDELLDYLRSRDERQIIMDLNFLREVGEACKTTRFRFMTGIQESLFDNPRFQFVAESIQRIKDRFTQIRISREDVSFVVSERLLKKDARQKAMVREHLLKFAPFYGSMNERIEEFVRLFPVHPAFLEIFERVHAVEKREVLKTISAAMKGLMSQEVPSDSPGLISYDYFWQVIKDTPAYRTNPDIKAVLEKSEVLEGRVAAAFPKPARKPMALRLVHALSVHRLTVSDIKVPIGATPEELRDDLCLIMPGVPEDADFLANIVEAVLKDIRSVMNGQFIGYNPDSRQYYLDLDRIIDYDTLIEQKAENLNPQQLDRYFFEVLAVVMECLDQPCRTGFRIWEREVEWRGRGATRLGYLFFGAPNERPNTLPVRDFYLYFMEPFDPTPFKDERRSDEVIFRLKHRDDAFERALRLYAAARELEQTASSDARKVYAEKAKGFREQLNAWLSQNIATAVEVSYKGKAAVLTEAVKGKIAFSGGPIPVRDLVFTAASVLLSPYFEEMAPEYPYFRNVLVTKENRIQAVQDALKVIAKASKSKLGLAVLDALELLDGEVLRPRESRYAKEILRVLGQKEHNQVVNREELVTEAFGVEYWERFRLEPEFLVVVLAALVESGDLVLAIAGNKLDAAKTTEFARLPLSELCHFKHIERPKGLPLGPLQELFELLSLPKGLIVAEQTREEGVIKLQSAVEQHVAQAVQVEQLLRTGIPFWGQPLVPEHERQAWLSEVQGFKSFLESLRPMNTVGKLSNFSYTVEAVQAYRPALNRMMQVVDLAAFAQRVGDLANYVAQAEKMLPVDHPWRQKVAKIRAVIMGELADPVTRSDEGYQRTVQQQLTTLKAEYQALYQQLHARARLGVADDKRKERLNKDARLTQLRKVAAIELVPKQQLKDWENRLLGLTTCWALTEKDLAVGVECPHCHFQPSVEGEPTQPAGAILDQLEEQLDRMVAEWTGVLLDNLQDPTVQANLELLTDPQARAALEAFMREKVLPEPVTDSFVKALQEVFTGLERVVISMSALQAALAEGGLPCTVKDLEDRFKVYLSGLVKGKDSNNVRLIIE